MRRKGSLWALVLALVIVLGQYAYADFFIKCNECNESDSGTASGDGVGTVGTSNGSAIFRDENGNTSGPPTFESLQVHASRQIRFTIVPQDPGPGPHDFCTGVECDYNALRIDRLRFFVTVDEGSPYCVQNPSSCVTIGSIKLGGSIGTRDPQIVIYSTDLVVPTAALQLDLDEVDTLRLTPQQAVQLDAIIRNVRLLDPAAQFYVGLAATATAVDPDPGDGVAVKIVPFSGVLSVDVFTKKEH